MEVLPSEILLKIISYVEIPVELDGSSSFYLNKIASQKMQRIQPADALAAVHVIKTQLRRLENGVWDARFAQKLFADFHALVAKAFSILRQGGHVAQELPANALFASVSSFSKSCLALCDEVEEKKRDLSYWPQASSFLAQIARRLEEASMLPCWSLVSHAMSKALLHSYASPLWKQWAFRRWPQLGASSSLEEGGKKRVPPSDWMWREYCRNRVMVGREDREHVVDNCFEILCPLKMSALTKVDKNEYSCNVCKESVYVVEDIEELEQRAEKGQCVVFDGCDINIYTYYPKMKFMGKPAPRWAKERTCTKK